MTNAASESLILGGSGLQKNRASAFSRQTLSAVLSQKHCASTVPASLVSDAAIRIA